MPAINPIDKTHLPQLGATAAIIVTYNAMKWIENCIATLRLSGVGRIIVVDNASSDDTVAWLAKHCTDVHTIRSESNIGFGSANNVGIQMCINSGIEYILLVNQDIILEDHALSEMMTSLLSRQDIGIISAVQKTYDGNNIDPIFSNYLPPKLLEDVLFGQGYSDVYNVNFVPAACVLIPVKFFQEVGMFDPLFFLYCEDDDLCKRAINSGYNLGIAIKARVRHWHGLIHKKKSFQRRINWWYSNGVLFIKHYPRPVFRSVIVLAIKWLRNTPLQECLVRFLAWFGCLFRIRTIKKHRNIQSLKFAVKGEVL